MSIKKIVYLFGAGATHAEVMSLEEGLSEVFIAKNGLLIAHVSKRVILAAQSNTRFKRHVETVTSREGSLNIELLISLLESNRVPDADFKVSHLKKLVQADITARLSAAKRKRFYLHKGLLELQNSEDANHHEELLGFISLNYDGVLDEAYQLVFGTEPNYCLTSERKRDSIPLLKLHGSFNWHHRRLYGKVRDIPIIPLGVNKNYLAPPYNFIWGRALELLIDCDILRVVGCSLNQNDIGLIDLLFKAHLERNTHFDIEIIDRQGQGENVKNNFGFFPGITKPKDIEGTLIPDEQIESDSGNPFRIWLRASTIRHPKQKGRCLGANDSQRRILSKKWSC